MMSDEIKHEKCGRCKCWRLPSEFLNDKKRKLKTCSKCRNPKKCPHDRRKSQCKDCGGGSICSHDRQKSRCKDCGGSPKKCPHGRRKSRCKDCGGGEICSHGRQKSTCKDCDPMGHLGKVVRSQVYKALKNNKELSSTEYLGCSTDEFKQHIEKQFKGDMNWENYGIWHIDHITPLKYDTPTIDEVIERLHWTNTQPMWASENMAKGNRFIG